MRNLISADLVLSNVKDFLSSYDKVSLIEDSDLYRWIAWVNNRLGISVFVESEKIEKVEKHKVPVPSQFDVLWSIHKCSPCEGEVRKNDIEMSHTIRYTKTETCENACSITVDEDPTIVTEVWKLKHNEERERRFCNRQLLSLGQGVNKQRIHGECANVNNTCVNEFSLDENYFYFNFTDCYVHMQYYAAPFDEDGYPLIVDDEYVLQALEDHLIYKSLQKIFINGQVDVLTRMQYSKVEATASLKEALFNEKLDSFNSLVNASSQRPNFLEVYNLSSTADGRIHKS